MTHTAVANAQVVLSILFILGFFGAVAMQGLGVFKVEVVNTLGLGSILMLVMSFWFQRQRTSGDEVSRPDSSDPAVPTKPAPGPAKIVN